MALYLIEDMSGAEYYVEALGPGGALLAWGDAQDRNSQEVARVVRISGDPVIRDDDHLRRGSLADDHH